MQAVRNWLQERNKTVLEFTRFTAMSTSYDAHLEELLDRADLVVAFIASFASGRGNAGDIRIAYGRYRIEGRPKILTVTVNRAAAPPELRDVWDRVALLDWNGDADTPKLLRELAAQLGDEPNDNRGNAPFANDVR